MIIYIAEQTKDLCTYLRIENLQKKKLKKSTFRLGCFSFHLSYNKRGKMENQINIDESNLLGYFSDTISLEERKKIEEWMSLSEENRKMAEEVYYIYFVTDTRKTLQLIDSKAALINVNRRINKRHTVSVFLWVQRVAAVLFVPFLLSTLYYVIKKEPLEYLEIRTNPGMVTSVNLPDGTQVWLNSGSYLKYPSEFTGNKRNVVLEGEAYFKVQTDKKKPFLVNTKENMQVEVLGTEFNLEAYPSDSCIATTLVSGAIKLTYNSSQNDRKSIVMKPNEQVVYNERTKTIKQQEAFTSGTIAWKEGKMVLRNTPLVEVLKQLSKRFDVDFILKRKGLEDNYFTGTFDNQQLPKIMELLRKASDMEYRIIEQDASENGVKEKSKVELY